MTPPDRQASERRGTVSVSRRPSPLRRAAGIALAGAGLLASLSGCSVKQAFSLGWPQGGVSVQSQKIYNLYIGSVVAALVIGALVWGLIFWCVIRYRKRGEALPPQTRFNLPIEIVYTVLPFLIISVLFYYTVVVQTDINKVSANPDVTVTVEAFKWNWKFNYDGVKGADGLDVYTVGSSDYVPVLVVPTHEKILVREMSKDVIHSFWVPDLLFKRDVFPGTALNKAALNKFEVTIVQEGAYVGRCAELCGAYHSMMNFELRAVTPAKYVQFLAAKQAGKSTPEALAAIGEAPLATTTSPFVMKPNTSS
jgi:cytochrome c oxidase subunit 2